METWPEIMLMIDAGTKNGEMRRGPRFAYSDWVRSISGRPPMPAPMSTPMRSPISCGSSSPVGRPASLTACSAEAAAQTRRCGLPPPQPVDSPDAALRSVGANISSLGVGLGVVDGELHGRDLLGFLVGDLDAEFVFEGHHEFDGVERIGAQVGHE